MWKIFSLFGKGGLKGAGALVPRITALTTRAGRRRAFKSASQFSTAETKKKLANRLGQMAVDAAVTSAVVTALDRDDADTSEANFEQLKEGLADSLPGVATCQNIYEIVDLLKCHSLAQSCTQVGEETVPALFAEAASILRCINRVTQEAIPTRTLVSRTISIREAVDRYNRDLSSTLYLIGYFLGLVDADADTGAELHVPSLIDYLLFGFAKAKNGISWANTQLTIPVQPDDLEHLYTPIDRETLVRYFNALYDTEGDIPSVHSLVVGLTESFI